MANVTPAMRDVLLSDRRLLCWLFWVEGQSSDLYAWSGLHDLSYGGNTYKGVAHVAGMQTIRKTEDSEHVEQQLTLSGLDPTVIADLDTSVRGRSAKIWLAALNDYGQVIAAPILLNELNQDTLSWQRGADDTVTLTLNCWEALPFVGRATNLKWSNEGQMEAFPSDTGFKYNATIALTGAPINWQQG